MMEVQKLENSELQQVIERAHDDLNKHEFHQALHHAEAVGKQAGRKNVRHWSIALLLGVALIAGVLGDFRIIFVAPLLFFFLSTPFIMASYTTARREAEKEDLIHTLHEHERKLA